MQLATSTLLILCLVIPGIGFLSGYYAGKFPRHLASLSPLSELVLMTLWAIPIDAFALHFATRPVRDAALSLAGTFLGLPPTTFGLTAWPPIPRQLWWDLARGYMLVVVGAAVLALLLRRIVWVSRFDVWWPMLRMKQEWYYILQGRLRGLARRVIPYGDVLTEVSSGVTILYSGIVSGFDAANDGSIKEVVLIAAQRHSGRGDEHLIKDIPGDYFVVLGSTIRSINMRFLRIEAPGGLWRRLLYRTAGLWRAIASEEP